MIHLLCATLTMLRMYMCTLYVCRYSEALCRSVEDNMHTRIRICIHFHSQSNGWPGVVAVMANWFGKGRYSDVHAHACMLI